MAAPLLDLHVTASGDSTVVEVGGEIDVASALELRDCLYQTIDIGSGRLVVDLREVSFIDSIGLGVLVGAKRRLRGQGPGDGSIQLVCAEGLVLRVLRLTGLDGTLPCMPPWLMRSAAIMPTRPGTDPARARITRSLSLPEVYPTPRPGYCGPDARP
jgi:anti-sigma B factor antagonist